jgi:hypothetical protein
MELKEKLKRRENRRKKKVFLMKKLLDSQARPVDRVFSIRLEYLVRFGEMFTALEVRP